MYIKIRIIQEALAILHSLSSSSQNHKSQLSEHFSLLSSCLSLAVLSSFVFLDDETTNEYFRFSLAISHADASYLYTIYTIHTSYFFIHSFVFGVVRITHSDS